MKRRVKPIPTAARRSPRASRSTPAHDETARPIALVTGAARRVGRAIALELARHDFDLILTCHTSTRDARTLDRELRALHCHTRWLELDLADLGAVDAAGHTLARGLPRLDALVLNASTYAPSPLARLNPDAILDSYRVNAAAPLLLAARLAPLLARSPLPSRPSIVALGDMHAMGRPRKDHTAYLMSKAALHQMTRSLARELAPAIRVNAIAPGVIAFPESGPESRDAFQRDYLARVPLARAGTPQDAAALARWLILEAPYITGEIIRLDGGRWLA